MYIEKIINLETSEETIRQYTDAEIVELEKARDEMNQYYAEQQEIANKRNAALGKLAALGLDEDDLKALGF